MTPPQDVPAECSVLGSMMRWPDVIHDVTELISGPDYYRPNHETIHDAIVSLHDRREPTDMVTLAGELQKLGELERIGGAPYLHDLTLQSQTQPAAIHHAEQVADAAVRRRCITAAEQGIQLMHGPGDTATVVGDFQQAVSEAASQVNSTEGGTSLGDGIDATIDWLQNSPVGADTPWVDVNERTNGILEGQLITVGGRPGHGKSLVAKDVGLFTAKQGKPVHIATLEMSRHEYMARILSAEARVPLSNLLRRQMSDHEWEAIARATAQVRDLPLYLDDREGQTMAQIRAAARRTSRRYGKPLGLVAIDYAGLVRVPGVAPDQRRIAMGAVSGAAKSMAKEFHCPVLLMAQLNRGNTQRADHTPTLTDLKESGDLEQDSDQVWLLHRPDQYGDGTTRPGEVDLIVGKNRNGPAPVIVSLSFQGHYARIVSMF